MDKITMMAASIRRDIVELTYRAGRNGSHIGGAMSAADIFAVLYGQIMRHDPKNPLWEQRDRFFLSKGHTAVGLYATLYESEYLTQDELYSFETDGSDFPAHCVMLPEKGVELSSGSLGMGLSFGVGSALAAQKKSQAYRVYVLLGNGECNEGAVWEAVMTAAQLKLHNLIAVIDNNKMQLDGESSSILSINNFAERFEAFGWNAVDVDGNNIEELICSFQSIQLNDKPTAIIANTVKGKGASFMEGQAKFHHAGLSEEEYNLVMSELGGKV